MYDWLYNLTGSEILAMFVVSLLPLFVFILPFALFAVLMERKVSAHMQDRLGPMRTGWHGWIQTIADILKLIQKEDIVAKDNDKLLFNLAPIIVFTGSYAAFAAIPFTSIFIGTEVDLGIFYIIAVTGIVVAGILMAGWASNNKYALYGSIRAASQMISYELAMGMAIVALIMYNNSLNLNDIVEHQKNFNWNIIYQPIGFLIFMTTALAECNRAPFDLPECESELIGGYHTEYSSMKLGFYLFAEYINMFVSSAVISTLYFGGYDVPFADKLGLTGNALTLVGTAFLFSKILFFIFFFMWIRWTLPRFRYDQLMNLGWKILVPLAILNMLITGFIITYL